MQIDDDRVSNNVHRLRLVRYGSRARSVQYNVRWVYDKSIRFDQDLAQYNQGHDLVHSVDLYAPIYLSDVLLELTKQLHLVACL